MSGVITLNDLKTKFRSAGQYTVIVDNSITPNQESVGIIRLVAGFSKSGNWNAPFFINRGNTDLAKELYGDIDPLLERKKSFFQRFVLNSLEEGDVLALNLLKTVDEVDEFGKPTSNADVVNYLSMSLNPNEENGTKKGKLYSSFYNKERFWSPSPEYLIATREIADNGKLLNFVNLGQRKITLLVRKTNSTSYEQKARDWFGSVEKVPSYINPDVQMKEYFVDVFFIGGDFTDYDRLKNDVVYAPYFNGNGLIADKFNEFINLSNVAVLNLYTGSIVPNVRDANGNDLSIDTSINRQTSMTGILCSLDYNEFDKIEEGTSTKYVDLLGSSLVFDRPDKADFLSYKGAMSENAIYNGVSGNYTSIDSTGITITNGLRKTVINIPSTHDDFEDLSNTVKVGSAVLSFITDDGVDYGNLTGGTSEMYVTKIQKSVSNLTFEITSDEKQTETVGSNSFVDVLIDVGNIRMDNNRNNFVIDNVVQRSYLVDIFHPLYADWKSGRIKDGDIIKNSSTTYWVSFKEGNVDPLFLNSGFQLAYPRRVLQISLFTNEAMTTPIATSPPTFGSTFNYQGSNVSTQSICIISEDNIVQEKFAIRGQISGNTVYYGVNDIENIGFNAYTIGSLIVGKNANGLLLAEITNVYKDVINNVESIVVVASEDINIVNDYFTIQKEIDDIFTTYNLHCLEGFTIKDHHMPNGTNDRMKEIYGVMTEGNIRKGLIDPDFANWRYFIDTFGHGIESQSKRYLTRMFRDRQKCLGILNAPSVDELKKSVDPRFTDSVTPTNPLPTFNTKHLVTGGNMAERPKFRMSLPSVVDGVDFAGWFFPFLTLKEDGYEKLIPPASHVGNAFMRKWNGGGYGEAVAGNIRGILTGEGLEGVELHLDKEDRGDVKQFGMNPIYKRGNTIMIYGNNTGLTEYESILENIHARDTLIQMEIDIERILQSYEFIKGVMSDETQKTILETSINNYLENQRDSQRNITEFTLKIDRSNNPSFVVYQGVLIIDIGVTIAEVTDTFITRITLNRAGAGVSVSAFQGV